MKVRIDLYTDNKVLASQMFVELTDYIGRNDNLCLTLQQYSCKPLYNIDFRIKLNTEVLEILEKYENLGFSDDSDDFND